MHDGPRPAEVEVTQGAASRPEENSSKKLEAKQQRFETQRAGNCDEQ